MNTKLVFTLLAALLATSIVFSYSFLAIESAGEQPQDLFVGIDVAYENMTEIKALVDKVSPYTNLFIIGCKEITYNASRLNETCQFLYDKGLNFMIYRDTPPRNLTWTEMAKKTWGTRFMGYYAYDELGGWQLDLNELRMVENATDYSDASASFVNMSRWWLDRFTRNNNAPDFNLYTSDYALYWFDYKAGYDTVFTQFIWNHSRQINIAQCRGAANMFGKDWGAIITWTYDEPPYLESGDAVYQDMVLAYENGAKYIILFDSNEGWTESVLKQDHLDALSRFWEYAKDHPRPVIQPQDRIAYVLPKDYGFGFRGPDDKIWGFWGADNLSSRVYSNVSDLITKFGDKLDIIYEDGLNGDSTNGYSSLFFWNGTIRGS